MTEIEKLEWPAELTEPLREVLGLMNFRTVPIAHAYRRAGFDIPHKCEDEQAFVLHRFIDLALKHGADWRRVATEDLRSLSPKAEGNGTTPPKSE